MLVKACTVQKWKTMHISVHLSSIISCTYMNTLAYNMTEKWKKEREENHSCKVWFESWFGIKIWVKKINLNHKLEEIKESVFKKLKVCWSLAFLTSTPNAEISEKLPPASISVKNNHTMWQWNVKKNLLRARSTLIRIDDFIYLGSLYNI